MQMGVVFEKLPPPSSLYFPEGPNFNPGYRVFLKTTDLSLSTLSPSEAFVWLDESMSTIQDGFFQIDSSGANGFFPDVPGAYHGLQGCGFSFADGHAENHKWQTSSLRIPTIPGKGYNTGGPLPVGVNKNNVDWIWLSSHATVKK